MADLGPWGGLIRELADWDPGRYDEVARRPLAEALLAAWIRARELAVEQRRFEVLSWQLGGSGRPPELPEILRGE